MRTNRTNTRQVVVTATVAPVTGGTRPGMLSGILYLFNMIM